MRTLVLFLLCLASGAMAQGTIEFREAQIDDFILRADTTGRVAMDGPDGQTVYVGDLWLELGEGDVESVGITPDPFTGTPLVSLAFAPEASEAFARITGAQVGKTMAIVLDGRLLSAPRINGRITGGRVSIEGVTMEEAETLAESIRETVGGVTPREFFRRTLDIATPEAVVETLSDALRLGDWQVVARLLHPEPVRELRAQAGAASIRLIGEHAEIIAGDFDGVRVPLAEVLGSVPPGMAFADLSDVDAVALLLALSDAAGQPLPLWSGLAGTKTIGTVEAGERVYVVRAQPPFEGSGLTTSETVVVERIVSPDGPRWVVLLPL